MGNGTTLGLTNGTKNGSPSGGSDDNISAGTASYGQQLPYSGTQGTLLRGAFGVTTDPEKSGITLEKEPWIVFIAY